MYSMLIIYYEYICNIIYYAYLIIYAYVLLINMHSQEFGQKLVSLKYNSWKLDEGIIHIAPSYS